jgi:membrane protease YdiL (CAAX protease family)
MFFTVKNKIGYTLLTLLALVLVSLALKSMLGLEWHFGTDDHFLLCLLAVIGMQIVFNMTMHFLQWCIFGERYLKLYRAFLDHFESMSPGAMVCGGLMACGEELFFRGIILTGLMLILPTPLALILSALLFGLMHMIPKHPLWIMVIWAFLEGLVLGGIYIWSGSLLLMMILHGLNDGLGFAMMGYQRRTGWLCGSYAPAEG